MNEIERNCKTCKSASFGMHVFPCDECKGKNNWQINPVIATLQKENAELKAQVEQMRNCENCGLYDSNITDRITFCDTCNNKSHWQPEQ